jgi:glycine/D-amino acid oxidase-like deaminating enzyme
VPGQTNIWAAVGAGHAAKVASLIGKVFSEQVLDGQTTYAVDAFRADRPALAQARQI